MQIINGKNISVWGGIPKFRLDKIFRLQKSVFEYSLVILLNSWISTVRLRAQVHASKSMENIL